jgi:hypothetical protein
LTPWHLPHCGIFGCVTGGNQLTIAPPNVRFWHKADIEFDAEHVRFRGQSGHL